MKKLAIIAVALLMLGGAFLCYLGARTFLAKPAQRTASATGSGLLGAYASTLVLTLTNPITILSFAAVFAGLGVGTAGAGARSAPAPTGVGMEAGLLVLGVFLGSALWWLTLSGGVSLLRSRFDARAMTWVNRISGAVIAGFGVGALVSLMAG